MPSKRIFKQVLRRKRLQRLKDQCLCRRRGGWWRHCSVSVLQLPLAAGVAVQAAAAQATAPHLSWAAAALRRRRPVRIRRLSLLPVHLVPPPEGLQAGPPDEGPRQDQGRDGRNLRRNH